MSTTLAESLISLSGIPSGPVALFALSYLTILFISTLEAGGKSKLKESGKTNFLLWLQHWDCFFARFNNFFTVALS